MTDAESPGDTLSSALRAVRERHFDGAGLACDYGGLARSPEYERLAAAALEAERGAELNRIDGYFARGRVRVAGLAYSLDEIEHGLLRGNEHRHGSLRGPLARDDPRLAFTPLIFDERVHFALYCACRSTPALRVYHGGRLEAELEQATREYLHRSVRIEDEGAVVVAPPQLHWHASDFGGEAGVLEFVLARVEDDAAVDLVDRRRGHVKLRYADFDWSRNDLCQGR